MNNAQIYARRMYRVQLLIKCISNALRLHEEQKVRFPIDDDLGFMCAVLADIEDQLRPILYWLSACRAVVPEDELDKGEQGRE